MLVCMRPALLSAAAMVFWCLSAFPAHAQTSATVNEPAGIYLQPVATRTPLRTAAPGTRLRVLSTQDDWLQVEFNDPQHGVRVGWIHAGLVRVSSPETTPLDLSVPNAAESPAVAPVPEPASPSVTDASLEPPYEAPGNAREGFWFNIGMGAGTLGCEDCRTRSNGFSGGLSFGGTLGRHVLLGVGTSGFSRVEDGELLSVGTVDARVRVYPSKSAGFFLTGGAGLGTLSYAGEADLGLGLFMGVGWDIRVGRNVSITPFWSGFAMANDTVDANVGQIGIGVTIH
jgi:hypothetical protein